jgi:hypothetical protein
LTVTGTETPSGNTFAALDHYIEGYNIAHLNWATVNTESVTLTFWVRSSLTGTFSGALFNGSDASFVYEYTILSANTWEKKTIIVSGPTTGTFPSDNSASIKLTFSISGNTSGAFATSTLNTWQTTDFRYSTNQTNLAGTSSATWDITGVQLEVGTFDSNSIPAFQFEDRATSLARCQRYTQVFGGNNDRETLATGCCSSSTAQTNLIHHLVQMRTTPSLSVSDVGDWRIQVFGSFAATTTAITISTENSGVNSTVANTTISSNAGSSVGRVCHFKPDITLDARLTLSAEL